MPKALFDIDDVVLDWLHYFEHWMEAERGLIPTTHLRVHYDKVASAYGMGWDEINEYIRSFHSSEYCTRIPFIPGARRTLEDMRNQGFDLIAVTKCGTADVIKNNRQKNLQGLFDHVYFTELEQNKGDILANHTDAIFYIDDSPQHAQEAIDLGISGYVFKQPKNLDTDLPVVNSWYDIRNLVEKHK